MSRRELDALEHEVEEARRRLALDIAYLRAPATFAGFKEDVVEKARETKDEWAHQAETTARDMVARTVADLKRRAAANPVAASAIAAGVLWHLVKRPPIGTALVGLGLYGLFAGQPRTGELIDAGRDTLVDLASQASAAAQSTAQAAQRAAAQSAARLASAAHAAQRTAADAVDATRAGVETAQRAARDKLSEPSARNGALLALAALVVSGAVAVALVPRRTQLVGRGNSVRKRRRSE